MKRAKNGFYLQEVKRIVKRELQKLKIGKAALRALSFHLEKYAREIAKRAEFFMKKANRKVISQKDIEEAIKEKSLVSYC